MSKCERCYHVEMCIFRSTSGRELCTQFKDKELITELHHGEWKINCDGYYPYCSECKNEPPGRTMTDYCPRCGAKMN